MPTTVFYSWQSDSANKVNRNFIEEALKRAIQQLNRTEDVLAAMRDEEDSVELDKDTQGVPGSPPIVDTIFEKISNAAVFVPDLTFVGKSSSGRHLPNPNVLIEYGWALKAIGHSRIVSVMNTASGEPATETMPFDMRHLRHPITYHLSETDEPEQKKKVKAEFAKKLESALAAVFKQMPAEQADENAFVGQPATFSPSAFWEKDETFGERHLSIPNVPRMFLRLIPKNQPLASIETSKQALELIKDASLQPMNNRDGSLQYCRNKYGSFSFSIEKKQWYEDEADLIRRSKTVRWLSQLFKTGEIWGVDCFTLDTKNRDKLSPSGYFPSNFADLFVNTLDSYLKFAHEKLQLPLPLKIIAGVDDVKNFKMKINSGFQSYSFEGNCIEEHLIKEMIIDSYDTPPQSILMPFFKYVWEECGLNSS